MKSYIYILLLLTSTYADDDSTSEDPPLYSHDDEVVILDADNFHDLIHNSSNCWFVKFYSNWCGHCKSFSPTYKQLANDIKDWQPIIRLASYDCSIKSRTGKDNGRVVCFSRPFYISGMPDMRFFPPHSDKETEGVQRKFEGRKVYGQNMELLEDSDSYDNVRASVIDYIQDLLANDSSILPLNFDMLKKKAVKKLKLEEENFAVIIESRKSYAGRMVVLDMTPYTGIQVHRISAKNDKAIKALQKKFKKFKLEIDVDNAPIAVVYSSESSVEVFEAEEDDDFRREVVRAMRNLPGVKRMFSGYDRVGEPVIEEPPQHLHHPTDKVYMNDLESALHYSLRKEVAGKEKIEGEEYQALKEYINVLTKFFPGRKPVMKFLRKIRKLIDKKTTIKWEKWQKYLNKANKTVGAELPEQEIYMGCSSSIPGYRGYPCALWQLFHVVMTQYARTAPDMDHHLVLSAMREYISHFFTCNECKENWKMATATFKEEVESAQDAVLYLWQRHNIVNSRLKSEGKEDPEYPKIQWPSSDLCDECVYSVVNDGTMVFDKAKTYEFLLNFYHGDNIEPIPVVEEPPSEEEEVSEDSEQPTQDATSQPKTEEGDSQQDSSYNLRDIFKTLKSLQDSETDSENQDQGEQAESEEPARDEL